MILCCGEALIDMLPRETTAARPPSRPMPAARCSTPPIALGRLGAPTGFLSGLRPTCSARSSTRRWRPRRSTAALAIRSDRPTTLAFVTLTDGQAEYAFYDENTAGRMITPDDLPDLPDSVEALFFGGISLPPDPCGRDLRSPDAARGGARG